MTKTGRLIEECERRTRAHIVDILAMIDGLSDTAVIAVDHGIEAARDTAKRASGEKSAVGAGGTKDGAP